MKKRFAILLVLSMLSNFAFSSKNQDAISTQDSIGRKTYTVIYTYEVDVRRAKEMKIEPLKQIERDAFDDFCKKIASPFLRIPKANIDETRRLIIYAIKLPKSVDYDEVARYLMICTLSMGLKISSCTIIDIDTVMQKDNESLEVEVLGSSFWNSWKIKNTSN